jgi:hypothetical protein
MTGEAVYPVVALAASGGDPYRLQVSPQDSRVLSVPSRPWLGLLQQEERKLHDNRPISSTTEDEPIDGGGSEMQLIERINGIRNQIAHLEADRLSAALSLCEAGVRADAKIAIEMRTAHDNALEDAHRAEADHAAAEERLAILNEQVDSGHHVEALKMMEAQLSVRSASGRLKDAESRSMKARRAYEPFAADDRLALVTADVLTAVIGCPISVRKRPGDAPEVTPLLVLSQVTPTEGFGTIGVSGDVAITCVGLDLDREQVREALEDAGCEVEVYDSAIHFTRAAWDVPFLTSPAPEVITEFGRDYVAVFEDSVRYRRDTAGEIIGTSPHKVLDSQLQAEDGTALGTVDVMLSVTDLEADAGYMLHLAEQALDRFPVGASTAMGRIVRFAVDSVKAEPDYQFPMGTHRSSPMYMPGRAPTPWKVALSMEAVYQPLEAA